MLNFTDILGIACYLLVIIFGTHFIRTWAFNRHEATTFECSYVAALIALLLIWKYGLSMRTVLFFAVLLAMFIGNSLAQWHFYMLLQEIIKKAFDRKADYLKKHERDAYVNSMLFTMSSVAIMPSFSRFIEESKLLNNPGGFIGLIKSIMKRQRFQKKKYLMRESFAENVNLIGPCQPMIESSQIGTEKSSERIPGAIHANDLALDYHNEKIGLFAFDILGFGALVMIFAAFLYSAQHPGPAASVSAPSWLNTLLMCLSLTLFTLLSHILRHLGFARYESVGYEFSFTALVTASFRVYDAVLSGETVSGYQYLILGIAIVSFMALSYHNKRLDKSLHDCINAKYDEIISHIPLEFETDRIKRKFLQNLKMISEWSIVPFPGDKRHSDLLGTVIPTKRLKEFERINQEKQDMPQLAEDLIAKIVPEFSYAVNQDDFSLTEKQLRRSKRFTTVFCVLAFAAVFVGIGLRML